MGSTCSTGTMLGNILGGRWSDYCFTKLKEQNGGKGVVEVMMGTIRRVHIPDIVSRCVLRAPNW